MSGIDTFVHVLEAEGAWARLSYCLLLTVACPYAYALESFFAVTFSLSYR